MGVFPSDLSSGIVKNVISTHNPNSSNVFACFLDAIKAFYRVNHSLLFQVLIE